MNRKSSYNIRKDEITNLKDELARAQKALEDISNVANKKRPESARISNEVPLFYTNHRTLQDISSWRSALLASENIQYPNRQSLYRLYKDVMLDGQVSTAIQARKAAILSSDFIVIGKNGKEDVNKTKWLTNKYFYDMLSLALDSIFFGFSLIQFNDLIDDKFTDVTLIPREYVVPELGIVTKMPAMITGQSYFEKPYVDWLLPVGERTNLGLISKVAQYMLYKKNAIEAWAEYSTIFGVPTRILHSDNQDPVERQRSENFLRNMAQSCYAILPKDDILEFMEPKSAAGAKEIFEGLINKCDEQIAKLILGQTSTIDNIGKVGSANVHKKQQDKVMEMDRQWIEQILKYQFIPFMSNFGFDFTGCKIEIRNDEELTMNEKLVLVNGLALNYDVPLSYVQETFGIQVAPKGSLYPLGQDLPKLETHSDNNTIPSQRPTKPQDADETPKEPETPSETERGQLKSKPTKEDTDLDVKE